MPRKKQLEAIASSTEPDDIFISPADSGRIVMDPEAITVTREPDSEATSTPSIVLTAEELVGGAFIIRPGVEMPILPNTEGTWSTPRPIGWRIGYTALLLPLRSEFPAPILPEPPITDAEWSEMVEAIRASEEDVIALPVPASCFDEFTLSSPDPAGEATTIHTLIEPRLRQCADALRVTACALGVGLTFYPRKAGTHTIREGKDRREEVVPAALMVRRICP